MMGKEGLSFTTPAQEGWNPEALARLGTFESWRAPVLRATRRLLNRFYDQHFRGNERVLEVGSGTGFLRRAWPDNFQGEWIQLDAQSVFLPVAKKSIPGDSYVCASASSLPFPDGSFDVVCGYSSYDVFPNLDRAIEETHRVLRKGGLFFHLIDLFPNIDQVIGDLKKSGLPYMISHQEGEDGYARSQKISFVPPEHKEEFYRECSLASGVLDTNDPQDILDIGIPRLSKQLGRIWAKYAQEIQAHPFFKERLVSAIKTHFALTKIETKDLTAVFRGRKTEQQRREEPESYTFVNEAGNFFVCKTPLPYYILRRDPLRALLNSYREYQHILYNWFLRINPSLAQRVEPPSVEISTVRCVMARKIDF